MDFRSIDTKNSVLSSGIPYSFLLRPNPTMPLLKPEQDIWPPNLLDLPDENAPALSETAPWWALYTLARFEKKLMRQLLEIEVPFFGPTIARRYKSPQGRIRTSLEPLFPNYVFIQGDDLVRYNAVCTGSVSRYMPVADPAQLVEDLRQIRHLILTDAPLSPELRLEPGQKVRVKSGIFKGFEGTIIRRENEIRLLISVRYMGRGASVALDDCQLEAI